ncbi:MAG: transcriptional repressor NrdR [Planctomycetes bacterium]|nr:transcriptional repressor NrdR [Planctomycetota bacterium]
MRCPFCNADNDKVIDSRATDGGRGIRRRRHCLACERRFTTYERAEDKVKLQVVKRDGSRVPYDRAKVLAGLKRATYKRPISAECLEQIADEVEEQLISAFEKEVSSQAIGEKIAAVLKRIDKVAYVRFASVYRQFQDVGDFIEEAQNVIEEAAGDIPGQQNLFDPSGEHREKEQTR